jgi:hypothetical protein
MRPAAFHSRSLNQAERNYPTHDKEMLAIIDCLKKWEPVLTGTRFEILTDHAPLTHWKTQKDLSPRQIRWNETLSRFDTDIHHIPGITNTAADALSRYPYVQDVKVEEGLEGGFVGIDEEGLAMGFELVEDGSAEGWSDEGTIEEEVGSEETNSTTVVSMDLDILDVIRDSYEDDTFFQPVLANPDRYPAYSFHNGLVYLRERLCIPSAKSA